MSDGASGPAAHAARPLFEPIAHLLAACGGSGVPDAQQLTGLLRRVAPAAASGSGRPIRFAEPRAGMDGYEAHIHATGEVPTRAGDWHDFFNALAWCVWPRSKAACNALHMEERLARERAGLPGRGWRRDALTQFDECGMVVVCADGEIPSLLAAHEWEEVFWRRRERLMRTTCFMVFGHGSWDQLRAPFAGLCAKAVYRVVEPAWLALGRAERQAETDAWLAARLSGPACIATPRDLSPLPLLGIPGVTPASECAAYYRDTRQFRPRREARAAQSSAIG
ncbi:DUF3025 domain-containing protein [Thauera sinica]|uniref:DUF3025 domain-containing protein n=1 Tax=Thauera sinica TaxID=2665146 RepID=A0ABW1AWB5_9RHOO|nr:DUF3025 domain-containing protein [Thauera sp. K11]ATE61102.1 hypothetical protein CCZ27_15185 [Thauera sp. K11]